MANEIIKEAVKVNGAKIFFYKTPKGEWRGTLNKQAMFSRTFLPEGTQIKEAETEELIINILKTDKVPLKRENLDKETIEKLEKAKVPMTGISPIEGQVIKQGK